MITIRAANDRGHADHGWLDTWHTFSFADYFDPRQMGFRALRVINEDQVAPGMGFGAHPHDNMEIITYVVKGALSHRDSMGHGASIVPGEVQAMSAGTGITHSEYNHSATDPVHLLQIWIKPKVRNVSPQYAQRKFSAEERAGKLRLIVSSDGRDESLKINQDADVFASILRPGEKTEYNFKPGRHGWLQLVKGTLVVNGNTLSSGDGAAISGEESITIENLKGSSEPSEFLFFDLP